MKLLHISDTDDRLAGKRGLVIWHYAGKIESVHLIAAWTGRRKELMLFDYDHYVAPARRMWWARLEWRSGRGFWRGFMFCRGVQASDADTPDFRAPTRLVKLVRG